MKNVIPKSLGRSHCTAANVHVAATLRPLLRVDGWVATLAVRAAGRRRAGRSTVTRASFSGQGPFTRGSRVGGVPGPRRLVRKPRDLQQLVDILSGRAADDPDKFLQLLSAVPLVMGRQRAPSPPPPRPGQHPVPGLAAESYAQQLQQQQQQQQTQLQLQQRQAAEAAAAAAEVRRRAQQEQEEEERREALRAAMLRNARRHLPQYDTTSLARLASGLAAAGVHDPALCDEMLRQMVERRSAQQQQLQPWRTVPEPRSLAELLDAFAAMRHRPTDAQLSELLRLQQQEQQQAAEQERLRQAQAQQMLNSQPRLQPRGMVVPLQAKPSPPPAAGSAASGGTSPEDAARLLYALSRLGYSPDEGTLTQLLEQLQPQRLQLQPAARQMDGQASVGAASPVGKVPVTSLPLQQHGQRQALERLQQQQEEELQEQEEQSDEQQSRELQDELSYSLQRDVQAVASAVHALERMGRPDRAQQLREHFTRHVRDVHARAAREQQAKLKQQQQQQQQQQEAAAAAAERERRAAVEAAELLQEKQHQQLREAAEVQRRQRQEEQVRALRQQLARKLRSADQWQQIRALLFTYQEALDADCLAAAAARLAELLAAARRTGRGLAMTLRERGELGDLLEGLGQLVLGRLEGATAAQAASLLCAVARMRHLEERLLVGLLRRLRDTLGNARPGELAAVVRALAECGVRPSKPWMEAFLGRCEELLEHLSTDDLAGLPVSLAQLGAHPGRSWLGAYLDALQAREAEMSQSAVSEAVRAVALLDRSFLSAWRQAAVVREQQLQQQACTAAPAAAATATHEQEEYRWQQQQQQRRQLEPQEAHGSALASVDEVLAQPNMQQDELVQEELLPPMHPKQLSMSGQEQAKGSAESTQQQQQQRGDEPQPKVQAQAAPEAVPRVVSGPSEPPTVGPMQSIELDVDAADLSCAAESTAAAGSLGTPPASATAATATSSAPAPRGGRQLPGSFSIDGYYNPEPYDEDDAYAYTWNENVGEGEDVGLEDEYEDVEAEEESARAVAASASLEEDAPRSAAAGAAEEEPTDVTAATKSATEASAAAALPNLGEQGEDGAAEAGVKPLQQQGQGGVNTEQRGVQDDQKAVEEPQAPPKQPTLEELAQARALRSLLLERYEAVAAYQQEVAERQRREAAKRVISAREVAAAAKVLVAQEQLERLRADFENFKRRANMEREQALLLATADALRPLLSVVDNFERAATQIKPKTEGERAVHETYQAVYAELKEFIEKQGLLEVGIEGEAFDPNKHEAVMREDRDDVEDGTVTGVFQRGYRLGDVLVRPALVKVAYS